jgi:pimeloyl-ACP methyl ester carboxylesterase
MNYMKSISKRLLIVCGLVLLLTAAFVISVRSGWLTPSDAKLREAYALPNSRFIEIDGEPIHYVDEGSGEPVILVHGSFSSLLDWNDWATVLRAHYRVIRFDNPPGGLSGPNPEGRYGADREMEIIDQLSRQLQLEHFFLVATSSGGIAGAAYAAEHPDKLKGLILSNIAVGPVVFDRSRFSSWFKLVLAVDPYFNGWHPRALWRGVLQLNFADPGKVSDALVAQWTDLNNRAQRMPRKPGPANGVDRTPTDLPKITAPTLLLWSDEDHEVPLKPVAETALQLLGATDKQIQIIAHCGHMMAIECGPESVLKAQAFMDRVSAQPPSGH